MEPTVLGARIASAAIGPILKKLLVSEVPGAGLTGAARPVRLSALLSFRREPPALAEKDVRRLAATLVERTCEGPGEPLFPADETEAVTDALAATLLALGELDMDDAQAVHFGPRALADRLRSAAPAPDGLSGDSLHYLETAVEESCRHLLDHFTRRPSFVPRTLVEHSRRQADLAGRLDALATAHPGTPARDAEFERRYLAHLARRHGRLTLYGVDLQNPEEEWPLDVAYLSLEAAGEPRGPHADPQDRPSLRADLAPAAHDRVLLRGQAGSGKTTLVQWLTVSACSPDAAPGTAYLRGRVPFVLPLRALARHGERLPDAERFLTAADCPLTPPPGWADRVLAAGRGLVLVDGIDEIPETERDRARDWLRGLLDAYGDGNRWLVTSRPTAVRDDWLARDGFTELTLSPMSPAEVATFVRRWHRAAGPDAAPYERRLLDSLRTTEHVAQLATNPLMCGLICALHRDRRGYLPRGRKPLYDAALSMLLTRRDRERGMGAPYGITLEEAPQIQLVQRLAYWLTLNDRFVMDRGHAESLVTEALPALDLPGHTPRQVFTHLLHRSGLLREPTADTVDFVHRTFQDYLAAKALVDHWDIGVLVRHAADDRWEDVLRMAVGHARPREAAEILRELLRAADAAADRPAHLRLVLLAATALGHATEVAQEVREEITRRTEEIIPPRDPDEARELASVGRMVLDLLPGPEGLTDREAEMVVITASHVTVDAAVPYLARFARHPSLDVRAQLVWAWQRFEPRPYAEEVVAALDPAELRYIVTDDERADELLRLGLAPRLLQIDERVGDARTAALLDRCDLTTLAIEQAPPAALRRQEGLTSLSLMLPPGLPWKLSDLPRAPLRELYVSTLPDDGLDGLGRYPDLRHLAVWQPGDYWRTLAGLTGLVSLAVEPDVLRSCPPGVVLPSVTTLHLRQVPTWTPLERIFPRLRKVVGLRSPLPGAEHLPPHVEVVER
ncbi:NACHT domain-containing protein [Streptomyces termitum]|uniref:NACHT domain-containing protein n=1 Tax=Streptomyces termitum TaxID=67368 RepID=UPI0037970FB4